MTKEEYSTKYYEIKKQACLDIDNLKKSYAYSNNPHKIDDIIEDHDHIIKIKKIQWYNLYNYPECVYTGLQLTKKLKTAKNQKDISMYQSNIISKHEA